MLKFECPHCGHIHNIKQPKAGRFRPPCSKCGQTIELTIAADLARIEVRASNPKSAPAQPAAPGKAATGADLGQTRLDTVPPPSAEPLLGQTRDDPQPTSVKMRQSATRVAPSNTDGQTAVMGAVDSQQGATTAKERLGGYRLIRELGRGGLGVVYLAQQLTLNRKVAVKLIQSKIAQNSHAISRFFREAYAAAQLVHHNVVQIYDLGEDNGTNFFSMEFVQGKNLAEIIHEEGPLEPRRAASYILQAARGLQFAHAQGMVHRDVKPANLMLDQHGVVKVADLGLVKLPATADEPVEQGTGEATSGSIQLTGLGATVGTVSYIAPEQAASSSTVDHRADIYSLGCSLYMLLTGAPPFRGKSAQEVIQKHKTQPIPRPETVVPKIDRQLSDIVMRMVEKRPEDRYSHLGLLIQDLQRYLGMQEGGALAPTKQQVQLLENAQKTYYRQSLASARSFLPWGFVALGIVAAVIALAWDWRWSLAILWGLCVAPATAVLIAGWRQQSRVYDRLRSWIIAEGVPLWLKLACGGLLGLALVYLLGMIGPWLLVTVLAAGLGLGYVLTIEQGLAKEREPSISQIQQLLRDERVAGVDEESLQRFVAKYSGADWEEFFEDLFGYEALRRARVEFVDATSGPKRKRYRAGRDRIIDRIDARLDELRRARDAAKLQKIEERALVASGMPAAQAAAEANRMAALMVEDAAQVRQAAVANRQTVSADPQAALEAKRAKVKAMLAEARSGAQRKPPSLPESLEQPLHLFLGPHVRLIVGSMLLIGCGLWIKQSGLFSGITVDALQKAAQSVQQGDPDLTELTSQAQMLSLQTAAPLSFPVFGPMVSSLNAGLAGLLLVVSVFFGGWRTSLILIPLAMIIWLVLPRILI